MKRQKGSAAVMALIFMLFLSLAGGAWVTMLAHENATAMNDEKDQQAWYAAEAGMKRAKAEIVAKNGDMIWLTDDNKFPKKGKTIAVDTGKDSSDANKALYAVYVGNTTEDSRVTHKIISVGYYMDSTKIISENLTTNSSGTGGGGGGGDDVRTDPSIPSGGLTVAGGTVTIMNSVNHVTGQIYTKDGTVIRENVQAQNPLTDDQVSSSANIKLYTKIADSAFEEATYGTFTELSSIAKEDEWKAISIANDGHVKFNWPLSITNTNDSSYYKYIISGGTNSVVYFNLNGNNVEHPNSIKLNGYEGEHSGSINLTGYYGVYTTDGIKGPTSGIPLTLIFDKDVYIDSEISGNVRIICKGNVFLGNRKKEGKLMVIANGNVYFTGSSKDCLTFISSDGDVIIDSSGQGITGQIQAAGNVTLTDSWNTYNNWVATDPYFVLPEMELHGS